MTITIIPSGKNDYNSGLESGDRVTVEQINYDGGNNSESVSKNLVRLLQDQLAIFQKNIKISGMILTPAGDNNRFINIGVGTAIINGRWISVDSDTVYQPTATTDNSYALYLELTSTDTIPRNPENETITIQEALNDGFTPNENQLVIGSFVRPLAVGDVVPDLIFTTVDSLVSSLRSVNTNMPVYLTEDNKPIKVYDLELKPSTWTESHLKTNFKLDDATGLSVGGIRVIYRELSNSSRIAIRMDTMKYAPHTHTYSGTDSAIAKQGSPIYLFLNKIFLGNSGGQAIGVDLSGDVEINKGGEPGAVTVTGSTALETVMDTKDTTLETKIQAVTDALDVKIDRGDNIYTETTPYNRGNILSNLVGYHTTSSGHIIQRESILEGYFQNDFQLVGEITTGNKVMFIYNIPLPTERHGKKLSIGLIIFQIKAYSKAFLGNTWLHIKGIRNSSNGIVIDTITTNGFSTGFTDQNVPDSNLLNSLARRVTISYSEDGTKGKILDNPDFTGVYLGYQIHIDITLFDEGNDEYDEDDTIAITPPAVIFNYA